MDSETPTHRIPNRRIPIAAGWVLLCGLVSASPGVFADELPDPESRTVSLEIQAMNGTWTDLQSGLVPVQQGPVTLVFESPAHELKVHTNRLVLEPLADGTIDVLFEADLEGWGDLEIELRTAASVTPMSDRVVAKRQWVRAVATVRLEPAEGGYWLTLVESLRPAVGIQIESQVGRQMVDSCRGLKAFPMFAALDCDALSASLSRVEIPMPEPGTRFHLDASRLTPTEKTVFDHFAGPAPD
jgi:hypothetical protein